MRTEMINRKTNLYNYGENDDLVEYDEYEYACPCGRGKIVETHDETPGNREHYVWLLCEECSKKYRIDTSRGVQNWDLVKIKVDIWNGFLEELNTENDFDKQLKEYLSAIKYVSEIKVENIDDDNIRDEINEELNLIVNFIKSYGNEYYEIGLIKGFKINEKIDAEHWSIKGRDYYYYVADQKIKASVYYVRYLNVINKYFSKEKNAEEELARYISEIQGRLEYRVEISRDNIIGVIDDELDKTEENLELRRKCIDCVEQIKTNDINYLKYMLFNNIMREIRYIGAAYQYLWHWETKKKNLFRYVSYDGEVISINDDCTKKRFLQQMFSDVIAHMNNSSKKLCSYSEDPFVDIFKYLRISKCNNGFTDVNSSDAGIKLEIQDLNNENEARFEIVKEIKVNSIYRDGVSKDFYSFVQDGRTLSGNEVLAYAVELYPDLPGQVKNSKSTTKNIKDLLLSYLKTWADKENVEKIMSYVADDKEVVTYGGIEHKVVDINSSVPTELYNAYRYTMKLNKHELIYLLLKIKNKDIDDIVKQIEVTLNLYGKDFWIGQAISGQTSENCIFNGKISMQITDKKNISINIRSEIKSTIAIDSIKKLTVDGCKKKIQKIVETQIQEYFRRRYNSIINEKHDIADFILKFIDSEGHKCPAYISEYNEYEPEKGDTEISILKYLVFKR